MSRVAVPDGLSMHVVLLVFKHKCDRVFASKSGNRCVRDMKGCLSEVKLNTAYPEGWQAYVQSPLQYYPGC